MNWYSNTGRARLVRELMAKGFSVRKAEKTVNAVFDRMIAALRRGERVELPVGWIQAKLREGKPRTQVKRLSNIHTRKTRLVIARYAGPAARRHLQAGREPGPDAPAASFSTAHGGTG
jgi:nucleoid DNA-binding protein